MSKELKKIMTDLAAGHITKQEADRLMKSKKVAEEKLENKIEGKEIAPINSKKGKAQRDKARTRLSREVDEEDTQMRKLNPKGGKK